jgi:hypothetical protein
MDWMQLTPLTAEELEERISALAVECGIVLKEGRAGFAPDAAPDLPDIVEEKDYSEAVWPWRRLMCECANYLLLQSLMFQNLLRNHPGEPTNFLRACWSLSTKAASDARCTLHLCDYGYVSQASMVARSCIESIEALAAFSLDRDSADTFVSAETPDQANHAWYIAIRKNARRTIDTAFAEIIELDEETIAWRRNNRRVLGAMTHPSFMAPLLNIFSVWQDGKEGHPVLPAKTTGCVPLFQAVADTCFEYASVLLLTARGNPDDIDVDTPAHENVGFFEEDWLDSYASRGHKFFQRLWVFFLKHQESEPFSRWRTFG